MAGDMYLALSCRKLLRTSSTLNRMRDTIVPSPNSPGEVQSSEVILVKEKERNALFPHFNPSPMSKPQLSWIDDENYACSIVYGFVLL